MLEVAVAIFAFLFAGTIKGLSGFGLPLVALPILAMVLDLPTSIAILALPTVLTNVWQIIEFRERAGEVRPLLTFFVVGGVGVMLGSLFLVSAPESLLKTALGVVIFAYLALRISRPSFHLTRQIAKQLAPFVGLAAGVLHGLAGLSAPISVTFVHAMRRERETMVFLISAIFLAFTSQPWRPSAGLGSRIWRLVLQR
ncbi:sulfite exporter TauE/SafE family protein [Bosea lathyri]|uniref:Probable membrane transporter protein n=1 Tax=Bosea lathyri TaxID=1036778 RepID=A0A1H6D8K1_9HYPH|nr:sulfite exporter TauE/SafE family protein [Bosea lathyri]SEG81757.1 hypothetical protein SAMN04488115_1194 [Bosea lathyri]